MIIQPPGMTVGECVTVQNYLLATAPDAPGTMS